MGYRHGCEPGARRGRPERLRAGAGRRGRRGGPPFHADWEARVYALAGVLGRRGLFTGDELRDAIESLPPERYLSASYYERWLDALEALVRYLGG